MSGGVAIRPSGFPRAERNVAQGEELRPIAGGQSLNHLVGWLSNVGRSRLDCHSLLDQVVEPMRRQVNKQGDNRRNHVRRQIMCIVNAPRIEIVLVPENQAQREGDEVEDDTLLDAYLIMRLPDGTNVNLKLDGGPFDLEAGTKPSCCYRYHCGGEIRPFRSPGRRSRRSLSMPSCGQH